MTVSMAGKVCVVTGASSGIGTVTARELARSGATVLATARDPGRGEAAAAEIRRAAPGADVRLLLCDFASQAQVRALAERIKKESPRLDVLVHNAGAINGRRQLTEDGLETTFAVNHLAPFLLTCLLADTLRASAPSRVVTVASEAHRRAHLDLDDLQSARRYRPFKVYGASKLANIAFTFELARRLRGSGVTANCLHPGVVATRFGSGTGLLELGFAIARPFMIGSERGARTTLYLATSPEIADVTGEYFIRGRRARPSAAARDPDLARRLWDASAALVGRDACAGL